MRETGSPIDVMRTVAAVGPSPGASRRELARWDLGVWREVALRFRPQPQVSGDGGAVPPAARSALNGSTGGQSPVVRAPSGEWLARGLSTIGGGVAVLAAERLEAPPWFLLGLVGLTVLVGLAGWPSRRYGPSRR